MPRPLIGTLRVSGKRTLAKLNAFAVLVVAQLCVAWLCVRFEAVRRTAKSRPTMLLRDGKMLPDAMARQRITAGEIRQAVRASGRGGLDDLAAIVMETDGTLSVVPRGDVGDGPALKGHLDPWGDGRERADGAAHEA